VYRCCGSFASGDVISIVGYQTDLREICDIFSINRKARQGSAETVWLNSIAGLMEQKKSLEHQPRIDFTN
jgi:hypothetical protein